MLKQFICCLIFCLFFICCNAQKNKYTYGFQSGATFNSAYKSNISSDVRSSVTGFSIGGHFKIQTSSHFGLKALMSYEGNGWAYKGLSFENNNNGLTRGNLYSKLNYINMPVLAEYSFGEKTIFYIDGGIFLAFLINSKYVIIFDDGTSSSGKNTDGKSVNFGASAGAGAQFPLAKKVKLDVGLRDNLGLVSTGYGTKMNSFAIVAGISVAFP